MTTEIQQGPLDQSSAVAVPPKKTWREQRWERRRRRIWFEEALGWILVPVILIAAYYVVDGALSALGTSPSAIMAGLNAMLGGH